jgi:flagellar basal-body rod modification protein FlgD
MTVDPTTVTGLLGAIGTPGAASVPQGAAADKDMFLELLVTQLRHQDPTNPTDSSQFLAQTAQFSALEAMQDVSERTAALLTAQTSFGAAALVGRTVTYLGADGTSATGVVESVAYGADGPRLSVGGEVVPLGQVTGVARTAGDDAPSSPPSASSVPPAPAGPPSAQDGDRAP